MEEVGLWQPWCPWLGWGCPSARQEPNFPVQYHLPDHPSWWKCLQPPWLSELPAFSIEGGTEMTEEELEAAGMNRSDVHVDFMIGSDKMDIDGIRADGTVVPIFRQGDWDIFRKERSQTALFAHSTLKEKRRWQRFNTSGDLGNRCGLPMNWQRRCAL